MRTFCPLDLLAIRLAWEWLLFEDAVHGSLPADWAERWGAAQAAADAAVSAFEPAAKSTPCSRSLQLAA